MEHFIRNLGASDWWRINVTFGKSITDMYSLGKQLDFSGMKEIVTTALQQGLLPFNTEGIYLVLTDANVFVDRFCTDSCGYHSYLEYNGYNLAFAFGIDILI